MCTQTSSCSCHEHAHHTHETAAPQSVWHELRAPLTSAVLLAVGMVGDRFGLMQAPIGRLVLYAAAWLPVALPVIREACEQVRHLDFFNEFTLMLLATIGAFALGEYPEAVAVMLFYAVGEWFQDRAVGRARHSVRALLDIRPQRTSVLQADGTWAEVHPQEVETGRTIQARAGERVSLDSTLLDEPAAFDTSALTGESVPRTLQPGEPVAAGMVVASGVVRLKVERKWNDSALSRILHMVEEAADRKAPVERTIRRFAHRYTPAVMALAVLLVAVPWVYSLYAADFHYQFADWLYRALVFMVISCPCAIVISIPLAYFAAIGAASHLGVLFKGGYCLDALRRTGTLVFDKTGTLTEGRFSISHAVCGPAVKDETELLYYLSAVERGSTHPLALTIVRKAEQLGVKETEAQHIREVPGRGMTATVDGHEVCAGRAKLLQAQGIAVSETQETGTVVYCAIDGRLAGYVVMSDQIKADTPQALQAISRKFRPEMHILSGDTPQAVKAVADRLHIAHAHSGLLPEEKVEQLKVLTQQAHDRRQLAAFVGDGINDAPALALADVGIAIGGSSGTDVAVETADVILQHGRMSELLTAFSVSHTTHRIVVENITFSLGIKLLILLLGAMGMASMWAAVFSDVGVALLCILNAMRIFSRYTSPRH